jgi:hypothetical protein
MAVRKRAGHSGPSSSGNATLAAPFPARNAGDLEAYFFSVFFDESSDFFELSDFLELSAFGESSDLDVPSFFAEESPFEEPEDEGAEGFLA